MAFNIFQNNSKPKIQIIVSTTLRCFKELKANGSKGTGRMQSSRKQAESKKQREKLGQRLEPFTLRTRTNWQRKDGNAS